MAVEKRASVSGQTIRLLQCLNRHFNLIIDVIKKRTQDGIVKKAWSEKFWQIPYRSTEMPTLFLARAYILLKGLILESQWTQASSVRLESHFACTYTAGSQPQGSFYLPSCSEWARRSRITGELHWNKNNPDWTKI